MTQVSQNHLLEILKIHCKEVAALRGEVKGYEKELLRHLAEIVGLERSNLVQPTHIQRQIADKVDTLGQIIFSRDESSQK